MQVGRANRSKVVVPARVTILQRGLAQTPQCAGLYPYSSTISASILEAIVGMAPRPTGSPDAPNECFSTVVTRSVTQRAVAIPAKSM